MRCPRTRELPGMQVAVIATMLAEDTAPSGVKVHVHDVPGRGIG